jgi:hypothetical protein
MRLLRNVRFFIFHWRTVWPGLPDVFFSNQKSQFRKNCEAIKWENVDL